jgi:hypothetical protein
MNPGLVPSPLITNVVNAAASIGLRIGAGLDACVAFIWVNLIS